MTGPITVTTEPDRSDDRTLNLLRQAINDPSSFVRRERWSDNAGIIPGWVYESVGNWGARAVVAALGLAASTEPDRPAGLPRTVNSLVFARIASGMSQKDLAKRLGVSLATVHSWETGRRIPTARRLEAWADALGLRLHLLPKHAGGTR